MDRLRYCNNFSSRGSMCGNDYTQFFFYRDRKSRDSSKKMHFNFTQFTQYDNRQIK